MWDDLDHFKLPDVSKLKDKSLSTGFLAETLIEVTNHYLDWAQHEPEVKSDIAQLKAEIQAMESTYTLDLQSYLALNFEKIPKELRRNKDLQVGWALNQNSVFSDTNTKILSSKMELINKQRKLEKIQSRLIAAKVVLDIGRSILSAMKEELRNL